MNKEEIDYYIATVRASQAKEAQFLLTRKQADFIRRLCFFEACGHYTPQDSIEMEHIRTAKELFHLFNEVLK